MLNESYLNVIRASGYVLGGIFTLKKALIIAQMLTCSALMYFCFLEAAINPYFYIPFATLGGILAWGVSTLGDLKEASMFFSWMRNKERVTADIDLISDNFKKITGDASVTKKELTNKLEEILSIPKVNKAALKAKFKEIQTVRTLVEDLKNTCDEKRDIFEGGIAAISSISSSFPFFTGIAISTCTLALIAAKTLG